MRKIVLIVGCLCCSILGYAQNGHDKNEISSVIQSYVDYSEIFGDTLSSYTFKLKFDIYDKSDNFLFTLLDDRCYSFKCDGNCGNGSLNVAPNVNGNLICYRPQNGCRLQSMWYLSDNKTVCLNDSFYVKPTLEVWQGNDVNCIKSNPSNPSLIVTNPTKFPKFFSPNVFDSYIGTQYQIDTIQGQLNGVTFIVRYLTIFHHYIYATSFQKNQVSGIPCNQSGDYCLGDTTVVLSQFLGKYPSVGEPIDTTKQVQVKYYRSTNELNNWSSIPSSAVHDITNIGPTNENGNGWHPNYNHRLEQALDTINDPTFAYNKYYTKYTYSVCYSSVCGSLDSSYCIKTSVRIAKPLINIPYSIKNVCTNLQDSAGGLILSSHLKYGGYYVKNWVGCYLSLVPIQKYTYTIYRDQFYNGQYDAQCSALYMTGTCSAATLDTIKQLIPGDYRITITTNSFNLPYSYEDCNNPYEFNFTVKYQPVPLNVGADRVLCEHSSIQLNIPPNLVQAGSTYKWFTTLCPTVADSFGTRRTIYNGQGGYHIAQLTTSEGCVVRDTVLVADLGPPSTPNDSLRNVLATSAVKFSPYWNIITNATSWQDTTDILEFADKNSYANGMAGIYRPNINYDYLEERKQNLTLIGNEDVKIKNDGVFKNYILFNYYDPNFFRCAPEWNLNNKLQNYNSAGYDIENKDILNNVSAALYGYNGKLPVAVAANAKYNEIGFESFEEYSSNNQSTAYFPNINQLNNSTGNIDLVRQFVSFNMPVFREYEIISAFNRMAIIKGHICNDCNLPQKVRVYGYNVPVVKGQKAKENVMSSVESYAKTSPCGDSTTELLELDESPVDFKCSYWTGKAIVLDKKFIPPMTASGLTLDGSIFHTGRYSLKIAANSRTVIPQVSMEFEPKQKYVVSAWIYQSTMKSNAPEVLKYTNTTDSIGLIIQLPNNEKVYMTPSGEVIEGWQRLEGTFDMPSGDRKEIKFCFNPKKDFNIDDVRIYPFNGNIQTYVYDPKNYKLRATLDGNNYATMYQYDDEGNLFAIKKETVKGIKTIQVSSSYVKSNQ